VRTTWIVDVHRDDRKRFVVRSDEKLTVFLELEAAIRAVDVEKVNPDLVARDKDGKPYSVRYD
jgi:hypothetical protein